MKSSPKAIFRTYGAQVCTLNCHMLTKSRLKVSLSHKVIKRTTDDLNMESQLLQ